MLYLGIADKEIPMSRKLDKELYTITEAAAYFGVTKATIYEWMKNRKLAWVWLGGRRRITREALRGFVRPGVDEPPVVGEDDSEYNHQNTKNTRSLAAV